jgi:hypothetical protein
VNRRQPPGSRLRRPFGEFSRDSELRNVANLRLYFAEYRHVRPAKDLARSLVASGRSAQREASRVQRLKLIFNCLSSATR